MADTSKGGLLLGGGICHITATQAEVKKFLFAYVILFQHVNFWQYFVCLRERIFNCCNVLMLSWSWSSRSNSKRLSPTYRYYLCMYVRHFSSSIQWWHNKLAVGRLWRFHSFFVPVLFWSSVVHGYSSTAEPESLYSLSFVRGFGVQLPVRSVIPQFETCTPVVHFSSPTSVTYIR